MATPSRYSWNPFTQLHFYHHDSRRILSSPSWNSQVPYICPLFLPFSNPVTSKNLSRLFKMCVPACHSSALQPLYSVWDISIATAFQGQQTCVVWYSPSPSKFLYALAFTSCAPPMLTLFLLLFKHCRFATSSAWNTFWQFWHSLFQHCHLIHPHGSLWIK